jgi:hypothetical protein
MEAEGDEWKSEKGREGGEEGEKPFYEFLPQGLLEQSYGPEYGWFRDLGSPLLS